ncbi:MAG: GNAT family N-acetyltransferase [Sphingomonadales bacterium]
MHIEIIETVDRLFEIELEWDELYKTDPHAQIYLSCQFIGAVALRSGRKFRVMTAWTDDQRCLGILPLVVTTRWSKSNRCFYNVLDMLGHVFDADYTGILCDPAFETEVCLGFAREISRMPFARVVLNYVSGPETRLKTFTSAFDRAVFTCKNKEHFINNGQTNNLICPYIDLPDSFSDYLAGLSANSRQKLRRLMRQLDSDPSLKISRSRPETYAQDVTILSDLWYSKHAAQKGEQRATHLAALFKDVIMLGLATGIVYLTVLWRRDKPVAAQANYIDLVKRHSLFHVAGRDQTARDLSAGLMLQAHAIRWSIANGLKRYDFTIGDEAYKFSLGGIDRKITSAEVYAEKGTNWNDRLDDSCREEVFKVIKKFGKEGRSLDAQAAAKQASLTWPDLEPDALR